MECMLSLTSKRIDLSQKKHPKLFKNLKHYLWNFYSKAFLNNCVCLHTSLTIESSHKPYPHNQNTTQSFQISCVIRFDKYFSSVKKYICISDYKSSSKKNSNFATIQQKKKKTKLNQYQKIVHIFAFMYSILKYKFITINMYYTA